MRILLVAGGAGFAGCNFIRYFLRRNKKYIVLNMDRLTYPPGTGNLRDIENSPRYHFVRGDICNKELVGYVMKRYRPNHIVNFATEYTNERYNTDSSVRTNIMGALTLMESAQYIWGGGRSPGNNRFVQISTYEVYGGTNGNSDDYRREESFLLPETPYAASKAGADLLALAHYRTNGLPAIVLRCCSLYGPYQPDSEFVPGVIINTIHDKTIKLTPKAFDIREWLYIKDLCAVVAKALFFGRPGEVYNIGSGEEADGESIASRILDLTGKSKSLLDRGKMQGADIKRYALNSYKSINSLHWSCRYNLEQGLGETVSWYKNK